MEPTITTTVKAPQPRQTVRTRIDMFFEITKRGSNVSREVRGGLVTFMTMAYIVILNPLIIGGLSGEQASTSRVVGCRRHRSPRSPA